MAEEELKMSVSPICQKGGTRIAYVSFTDETRTAEGRIPDCVILSNEGFTEDEVLQLQRYMKQELATLKRLAASVNVLDAFMGKNDPKEC